MLAERSGGDARVALSALERAVERAPGQADRRRRDRGRAAAQGARLRPPGGPPLRLRLGLDQGHPRLRRRRLALLPGGDAGGRRGPALHRPADGHPRLRGHRQRRPAGAAGRRRRRPRGRPGRAARVRAQPRPGGRPPGPGAEVQRLLQGARRRPRRGPRATAPRPRPTTCATPTTPAPPSSAAAAATATRTTSRAASPTSSCSPTASQARRFYAPTDRGFEAELGRRLAELRTAPRQVHVTAPQLLREWPGFDGSAFQVRARESRHTGRRPGLGVSGRDLHRGRGRRGDGPALEGAILGALCVSPPAASADRLT